MLGKASEIKCMVVHEKYTGYGIELFEITLNGAIESLGDREIIDVRHKQNHTIESNGNDNYYDSALIIYKEATHE